MADRDDHYRGYRDDSGRYADRGHFDRDYARQGGSRGTGERPGARGQDRDEGRSYDRDAHRGAGRQDHDGDRGFFDRAGDTVRSWLGDDDRDDRGRNERERQYGGQHRGGDHDRDRGGIFGGGGEYDRDHPRYRGDGGIRGGRGSDDFRGNLQNQERTRWSEGMNRRDEGEWHGRGTPDRGRYGTDDQDRYRGNSERGHQPWGGGDTDRDHERGDSGREYSTGRYGSGGPAQGGAGNYRGDRDFGGDRTSDRARGLGAAYGATQQGRSGSPGDDHYHSWRQQQVDALDRDYDEYRREHREKFHSEFGGWREQRQQQRRHLGKVREHMEVVGSDGERVGVVDKVEGDRIILTKNDPTAGGHHHSIPCSWIQSTDDKVTINKTAQEAMQQWRDEENRRALFEDPSQRSNDGPHILDRSFSGTYDKGGDNR